MSGERPSRWAHALGAALVLGVAVGGGHYLTTHKPEVQRRPQDKRVALVEVTPVERRRIHVIVEGSGTVVPSRVVDLQPEIRGRVVRVGDALRPGAVLEEGALIAQLDGRDYGVAIAQAKSARARAEAALELERAQQEVAKQEVALFEENNRPLPTKRWALREPQIDSAQASVHEAKASLMKAHLDLSRTKLTAPFDALVRSRGVSLGSRVTEATTLATVVGVDTWWIEAEIPKDELRFLPDPAAAAIAVDVVDEAAWGPGATRTGRVLEVGAEVVDGGRLVRVLVGVDDPLARLGTSDGARPPRLLLGSWVQVRIRGVPLDAVELPRSYVHDGDRVWVMDVEDCLDVRTVSVAARTRDTVLVDRGLATGDRVVTSALPWPVQGMQLAIAERGSKAAQLAPSAGPADPSSAP